MSDEQMVSEALRDRAAGAPRGTLDLDGVRGRARSIRRTRAAVTATGVATLVAAAALPVALLVGGDPSRDSLPPAGTPTVSDTANPVAPAPRAVGYVVQGEVHPGTDAAPFPPPEGSLAGFAGLSDGRWVFLVTPEGAEPLVVVTDERGVQIATYDALDGGLATDDAAGAVAWLDVDRDPQALLTGVDEPLALPGLPPSPLAVPTPVEVLPGCAEDQCSVAVETYDGEGPFGSRTWGVDLEGTLTDYADLGLLTLSDVSPDGTLATGLVSADEDALEFCSGVVEVATGELVWQTCEGSRLRFSPDGSHLLAIDAHLDGPDHSQVDLLDAADGSVLRSYEGTVFDEAWESAETYVVSMATNGSGAGALVRFHLGEDEPPVALAGPLHPREAAFRLERR